ncbi:MAG: methionyl-tRNA formyltransferase [Candidatus Lariskella arthropodorum]
MTFYYSPDVLNHSFYGKNHMNIVFMGTPLFAEPALLSLIESKHNITAVYTKPPSQSGRSMNESKSLIHRVAESYNIPVLTPKTLRNDLEIERLRSLSPDIGVVAAYGLILPEDILRIPKFGFVNIHPSDLPRWRGASPIQRTLIAGDTKTAMCIMQMDSGLDTGDIILRHEIHLSDDITGKELHDKMAQLGADMLIEAIGLFENNRAVLQKQSEVGVTYAEKIDYKEEKIDWNQDVKMICNKIRALSPKPGAYFVYNGEIIKIIAADYTKIEHGEQFGKVLDSNLKIACNGGILIPKLLQRQGRKMIYTDAFLRGYKIVAGVVL